MSTAGESLRALGQIAMRFAAAAFVAFLLDAAVFRYAYPPIVEPDSTTGSVEMSVSNEQKRAPSGYPEILAVGDSRMPLYPRVANEHVDETGYFYASIATPGTDPRCWYYMLRDVDPEANRYRAIVIPEYNYEDRGSYDRYDNRIRDLNYIVARLRLADVPEFTSSFESNEFKLESLRGALWKGFVFQRDFQEFLKDPHARLDKTEWFRRDQWEWVYNFDGDDEDLAGLSADWENGRLLYAEGFPEGPREGLEKELLRPPTPQIGRFRAYRQKWYGKILARYEDTETKLIFLRMARGPVVPPYPTGGTSVIRDLASHPNVLVIDEHAFDSMEDPVYFHDALHMNGKGSRLFSHMLANKVVELLGPGE